MFDVKVGDQLISLVDRPKMAHVMKGEVVIVTKVNSKGNISFKSLPEHPWLGDWIGNLREGHWQPVVIDLENK